jgi:uncharacterized protein
MKVILDTNILLSALISPHGTADQIYRAWRRGKFILVSSEIQLDELKRASRYPKLSCILRPHEVGTMINNLQNAIILDHLPIQTIEALDPHDTFLLAMATASGADYLITGDHRSGLIQQKTIANTQIVTAATFCLKILKHQR